MSEKLTEGGTRRRRIVAVACRISSLVVTLLSLALPAMADEVKVAVASNFTAAGEIARRFEETTGHRVTLVFGSTAKHYAQIRNGAPFQVFLAADTEHPLRLEKEHLAVPGSRFVYAVGHLILWSPHEGYVDASGDVLETGDFHRLAIANPRLAPYGRAAREVLMSRGLWERLAGRRAQGENIAQVFQFVTSGNAELGFIALSQLTQPGDQSPAGSVWTVPQELYTPIVQQGVLLEDTPAGRELVSFLRGDKARAIIRRYGYTTPDPGT